MLEGSPSLAPAFSTRKTRSRKVYTGPCTQEERSNPLRSATIFVLRHLVHVDVFFNRNPLRMSVAEVGVRANSSVMVVFVGIVVDAAGTRFVQVIAVIHQHIPRRSRHHPSQRKRIVLVRIRIHRGLRLSNQPKLRRRPSHVGKCLVAVTVGARSADEIF